MADKRKDVDKEEFKLKEEIDSIHDENLPFTSLESLCTVYVQEEDVKVENEDIKGIY